MAPSPAHVKARSSALPLPSELLYEAQYVPCNLCGSEHWELVATKDRHGDPLHTVLCSECGLVYTNPMPTAQAITDFYSRDYRAAYKGVVTPKFKHIYRAGKGSLERLSRIKHLLKPGMVAMDMGSGGGEFVYLLRKLGLDAHGVEPNEGYANFSRQEYDLPVQIGFWQTAEVTPESLDLLTAHHVVEHFTDPQAAFKMFASWMKPNGIMVIDVPNIEADNHAPEKKFHFAHVYNFNPYTLQAMAARAGFELEASTPPSGTVMAFRKTGKIQDLVKSKENAARVRNYTSQRTTLADVVSHRSLSDLLNRLMRQIREKIAVARFKRGRDILDYVYASETL